MVAAIDLMTRRRKNKQRQARKRKSELVAPRCVENCQIAHTVEQIAALLTCSPATVDDMMEAGRLPYIEVGTGMERKSRRAFHSDLKGLKV
jgi:excisionase family DNA binding protein